MSKLFSDFVDEFLNPLRIFGLEGEIHLKGTISQGGPTLLGLFGEGQEVMKKNEQLEQELSSEVRIRNLEQSLSLSWYQRYKFRTHLQINQVGAGQEFGEKVFGNVGLFWVLVPFTLQRRTSAGDISTAHHSSFLRSSFLDNRDDLVD